MALLELRAFDYLTMVGGETARRLIADPSGSSSNRTSPMAASSRALLAYVDADLNAKAASERLHIHVNTAHYRLGKIAERTGCDLRSVSDVLELVIAINLDQGEARGRKTTPGERGRFRYSIRRKESLRSTGRRRKTRRRSRSRS